MTSRAAAVRAKAIVRCRATPCDAVAEYVDPDVSIVEQSAPLGARSSGGVALPRPEGAVSCPAVGLELTEGLKRWDALSDVLAGTIRNDKDWNTIAQAVSALERIEQRGRYALEDEQITPDEREFLAWLAEVTWEANLAASLIGVAGTLPRWRHRLMFWRRVSKTELEETALELVRLIRGGRPTAARRCWLGASGSREREGGEAVPRDTS
jgi:hypothetical protein